jgi:hypothetical protein
MRAFPEKWTQEMDFAERASPRRLFLFVERRGVKCGSGILKMALALEAKTAKLGANIFHGGSMNILKLVLVCGLFAGANASFAQTHENMNPDAQAIDGACTQDAATAGCGSEKVGTGLLKCLHKYKKEHKKDFKFSESCKTAMKTMHDDKHGAKTK